MTKWVHKISVKLYKHLTGCVPGLRKFILSKEYHCTMKNKLRFLFLFSIGLFFLSQVFAQKPDYSGTWILNLEKSKLEHMAKSFTGSKFIIKQKGDKIRLTRYHMYGEKTNRLKFKMVADGKTRTVKLLFKGKLEWEGNKLRSTLWRKNFHNVVVYSFGSNENEFVADEVFKGLPQDHHNIWVFERAVTK